MIGIMVSADIGDAYVSTTGVVGAGKIVHPSHFNSEHVRVLGTLPTILDIKGDSH